MLSDEYYKQNPRPPQHDDAPGLPGSRLEMPQFSETQTYTANDFRTVQDGFTAPGDLSATVNAAKLLDSQQRSYQLRSASNLPFADLHGSPTVLIGSYNNYWTMELTRNLTFYFDNTGRIRERGGQSRDWSDPREQTVQQR